MSRIHNDSHAKFHKILEPWFSYLSYLFPSQLGPPVTRRSRCSQILAFFHLLASGLPFFYRLPYLFSISLFGRWANDFPLASPFRLTSAPFQFNLSCTLHHLLDFDGTRGCPEVVGNLSRDPLVLMVSLTLLFTAVVLALIFSVCRLIFALVSYLVSTLKLAPA